MSLATAAKRMVDLTLAGSALLLSAPLLAAIAAAVRIDSPGPIIFRQTRVGRGRKPIRTYKFRTMHAGNGVGPQITAGGDSRITRVGRLLRKAKLDELPQLFNVARGDMSLVGPRPEVPHYVSLYRPEWEPLFDVRPGITDLASLVFRDEEALLADAVDPERAYREVIMPIKLGLALEGVRASSFASDLKILARTLRAIVSPIDDHVASATARTQIAELNRTRKS